MLSYFADRQREDGSLGPMPWWNFVDWTRPWPRGVPPGGSESEPAPGEIRGGSAALDLQLLLAYDEAADLEQAVGSAPRAGELRERTRRLRAAVQGGYWDAGRGLYADTAAHDRFSQHANVLAVLAGLVEGAEARAVMDRVLGDSTLTPTSIYFRHYLHAALNRTGQGDRYLELLSPWREMMANGLTTWAETGEPDVRSDCHAWGASPNFELFRTVLGIDSAAPGLPPRRHPAFPRAHWIARRARCRTRGVRSRSACGAAPAASRRRWTCRKAWTGSSSGERLAGRSAPADPRSAFPERNRARGVARLPRTRTNIVVMSTTPPTTDTPDTTETPAPTRPARQG